MRRKWVLARLAVAGLAVFLLGSALYLSRETPAQKLARVHAGMTATEVDGTFARPADEVRSCPFVSRDGTTHLWEQRSWAERGRWLHVYFDEEGLVRDKGIQLASPETPWWDRVRRWLGW
jgi:hypothetical protein